MKEKTLLQQAKETFTRVPKKTNYSKDHIELAIAWAKDEITLSQCQAALKAKSGNAVYNTLLYILKQYVKTASPGA